MLKLKRLGIRAYRKKLVEGVRKVWNGGRGKVGGFFNEERFNH